MRVSVKEIDIAFGIREDEGMCPIALAVERKTGVKSAWVGAEEIIVFMKSGEAKGYDLPKKAQDFITIFDALGSHGNHERLKPFSFECRRQPKRDEA